MDGRLLIYLISVDAWRSWGMEKGP